MLAKSLHFSAYDVYMLFGFAVVVYIIKRVYDNIYVAFIGPLSKIPGPTFAAMSSFPFLSRRFRGLRHKWVQDELYPKYGKIIRVAPNAVSVADRDAVKMIVITEDLPKHSDYHTLRIGIERETLFSATDRLFHKQRRRMLSPAFSIRYLTSIEPFVESCVQELLEKLHDILKKDSSSTNGTVVNIYELNKHLALDVIGSTAFGRSFNLVKTGHHPLPRKVEEDLAYRVQTSAFPIMKAFVKHDNYLIEFVDNIIKERQQNVEEEARKDILQIILDAWDDNGTSMTNMEIYDQLLEFIIAGSDTTSFSLYSIIRFLVMNPDKKNRLVEELDAELDNYSLGAIPNDKLKSLSYLNACINESMRLQPIAVDSVSVRVADKDMMICGYMIPKGTCVFPNVLPLHRSMEYWGEDALEYKPERWFDTSRIPQDCYYPFSAGSRNCIGINFALHEIRLITASLFMAFNIEFVPGQPLEDIRHRLTPKLNDGTYYVRISSRNVKE